MSTKRKLPETDEAQEEQQDGVASPAKRQKIAHSDADVVGPSVDTLTAAVPKKKKPVQNTAADWARLRNDPNATANPTVLQRETWMLDMPEGRRKTLNFDIMQQNVKRFSRSGISQQDRKGWTDSPDGNKISTIEDAKRMAAAKAELDIKEQKAKQIAQYNAANRGESLFKMHLDKKEKQDKSDESSSSSSSSSSSASSSSSHRTKSTDKSHKHKKHKRHKDKHKRSKSKHKHKHKDKRRKKSKHKKRDKTKPKSKKEVNPFLSKKPYWDRDTDLIKRTIDPRQRQKALQEASFLKSKFSSS